MSFAAHSNFQLKPADVGHVAFGNAVVGVSTQIFDYSP